MPVGADDRAVARRVSSGAVEPGASRKNLGNRVAYTCRWMLTYRYDSNREDITMATMITITDRITGERFVTARDLVTASVKLRTDNRTPAVLADLERLQHAVHSMDAAAAEDAASALALDVEGIRF